MILSPCFVECGNEPNIGWKYWYNNRYTLYPNCQNGSAVPNKGDARDLDKKFLITTSAPEPLVQFQNYFTEMFLMMSSTKIAQMDLFGLTKGLPELLLIYFFEQHLSWSKFKIISPKLIRQKKLVIRSKNWNISTSVKIMSLLDTHYLVCQDSGMQRSR